MVSRDTSIDCRKGFISKRFASDKPDVHMESKYAYTSREEVEFMCYAVGYPSPEIRLWYQQCNKVPWQNCSYAEDTRIDVEVSQSLHDTFKVIKFLR